MKYLSTFITCMLLVGIHAISTDEYNKYIQQIQQRNHSLLREYQFEYSHCPHGFILNCIPPTLCDACCRYCNKTKEWEEQNKEPYHVKDIYWILFTNLGKSPPTMVNKLLEKLNTTDTIKRFVKEKQFDPLLEEAILYEVEEYVKTKLN